MENVNVPEEWILSISIFFVCPTPVSVTGVCARARKTRLSWKTWQKNFLEKRGPFEIFRHVEVKQKSCGLFMKKEDQTNMMFTHRQEQFAGVSINKIPFNVYILVRLFTCFLDIWLAPFFSQHVQFFGFEEIKLKGNALCPPTCILSYSVTPTQHTAGTLNGECDF